MSLPYFPLYPTDFEAKTSHLTMAEDGAYNRLLRICWMTPGCTIPTDEAWIMRRVRAHTDAEKDVVRAVLAEFFTVTNGRYSNARLMRVWLASNDAHEKRKNAGAKGGNAKALKTNTKKPSNALAMAKQPEPEPEPDIKREAKASPKRPARKTRMPEDACISQRQIEIAEEEGHSAEEAEAQFAKFKDYALANGKTYANWDSAWRNWFRSNFFKPMTGGGYGNGNRRADADNPTLRLIADAARAR